MEVITIIILQPFKTLIIWILWTMKKVIWMLLLLITLWIYYYNTQYRNEEGHKVFIKINNALLMCVSVARQRLISVLENDRRCPVQRQRTKDLIKIKWKSFGKGWKRSWKWDAVVLAERRWMLCKMIAVGCSWLILQNVSVKESPRTLSVLCS